MIWSDISFPRSTQSSEEYLGMSRPDPAPLFGNPMQDLCFSIDLSDLLLFTLSHSTVSIDEQQPDNIVYINCNLL